MNDSKTQPLNNFSSLQSEFFRKNSLLPLNKKHIVRKKYENDHTLSHQKYYTPQPFEDIVQQIRMKDKFDDLYDRIQKISSKEQFIKNRAIHRKMFSDDSPNKKSNIMNMFEGVTVDSMKSKHYKSKSIVNYRNQKNEDRSLQVNTILNQQYNDNKETNFKMILRKTRYKTKLDPIKKNEDKLSNNLRDYLHVGKITMMQLQQTLTTTKSKQFQQRIQQRIQPLHCTESNLLNNKHYMPKEQLIASPTLKKNFSNNDNAIVKRKFKPPFETYYYLDFIWKVQLSNRLFIKFANQYESKLKIYIGRGNNFRLVQSILKRRPWFTITDKIQEATFVWTQIKSGYYMSMQKKSDVRIQKKQIQYLQKGILTKDQSLLYKNYFKVHSNGESKIKQNMVFRNKTLNIEPISISELEPLRIHNHFKNNFIIGNKKALFHTMSIYYSLNNEEIFDYLPLTFHIKNGIEDDEYLNFLKYYYSQAKKIKKDPTNKSCNAWIVKPGQNTNRGNGIIMCLTLQQIKAILKTKQKHADGTYKTYIVQRYIQRPLLYKKRKFDLRHYMMISCLNGYVKGYWSRIGYVRTTSSEYTLKFNSGSIHLTNDAVQKQLPDYGKFQKGNKISYEQLQSYLQKCNYKINFWESIYPKMKKIATDSIRACASNLDPDHKRNFEIFGLDFMIDQSFNVWLIEINTNPCLQLSCPLLGRIIPKMLHDTFQINIDSIFTPAVGFQPKNQIFFRNSNQENSYQLVFDEREDNLKVNENSAQLIIDSKLQQEEQDTFEDDGEDLED